MTDSSNLLELTCKILNSCYYKDGDLHFNSYKNGDVYGIDILFKGDVINTRRLQKGTDGDYTDADAEQFLFEKTISDLLSKGMQTMIKESVNGRKNKL